jgi:small-conductance mechanosensitive channel
VAVFDNLAENAMEFSLRVFLADINRSLQAQTELRTAIVKTLRAEGIDIPYANALAGHAHAADAGGDGARTNIAIRVAHDADPLQVLDALRDAARRSGLDGGDVPPRAAFEEIDDTALEFSLSVSLPEGVSATDAQTVLRTYAVRTLRERGIALASPQRQVHLRDLDGLRTFLTRFAQERAAAAQEEATSPSNSSDDKKA